jgi:hypothetical protein
MVPYLAANNDIDLSVSQLEHAWEQIRSAWEKHNTASQQKFFVKIYNVKDLLKLGRVVGYGHLWHALTDTESNQHVTVNTGSITFTIDGVRISYFPTSLWPQESFLIDSDGTNRVATAQQYRLDQLHTDPSLCHYTVSPLRRDDNYAACYQRELAHWWKHFGKQYLHQEAATMRAMYQLV